MLKTKWLTLPLLIALVTLPRVSIDFYLPSLPNIGDSLHADDGSLQMTLTIFMFGYALSMLITGPLCDKLGGKRVLTYGFTLYFFASFACAISTSMTFLILARFFQALGGCCGTVIARVMVMNAYSREKQIKVLAQLAAALAICPLLIPVLGGAFQMYLGWRVIFYILAIVALLLLLIIRKQLNEITTETHAISLRSLLGHYKFLLTNRIFIGYSLTIALAWSNYFIFTLTSPFLLQTTLGFNAIDFGGLLAIVVLGYLIGTQVTRRYANQVGWDKLILIGTFFCLLGAIVLVLLNSFFALNVITLLLPMVIIMIGVGLIIPCTQGAVLQPFQEIMGTASGLFFFTQMLFGSICGLILQYFSDDLLRPMIIAILSCSLMLVVVFYKIIWTLKREEKINLPQCKPPLDQGQNRLQNR